MYVRLSYTILSSSIPVIVIIFDDSSWLFDSSWLLAATAAESVGSTSADCSSLLGPATDKACGSVYTQIQNARFSCQHTTRYRVSFTNVNAGFQASRKTKKQELKF